MSWNWPVDGEFWIVPADTAFKFGCIMGAAFVEEVSYPTLYIKTVGEAGWNPEHMVVFFGEFHTNPMPKVRGGTAQIHGYVKYLAGYHPYQFALRIVKLVMQASQGTLPGATVVVLDEIYINTGGTEFFCLPGFHEKPPIIAEYIWLDKDDFG